MVFAVKAVEHHVFFATCAGYSLFPLIGCIDRGIVDQLCFQLQLDKVECSWAFPQRINGRVKGVSAACQAVGIKLEVAGMFGEVAKGQCARFIRAE